MNQVLKAQKAALIKLAVKIAKKHTKAERTSILRSCANPYPYESFAPNAKRLPGQ